jgi:N-acetyl sugar amidotransferase
MFEKDYRICSRCVMDTTDPGIFFDADDVCNQCISYDELTKKYVFSGSEGNARLVRIIDEIKLAGRGKEYDCIIGVSGGVDSTYVAYKVKELGLRPFAVHLDNGWDCELAVKNIEQTLKILNIDLYTHVIDWEEFKDLQLSFLKASTPDSEIPSDHAIVSLWYQMARKFSLRYIITGCNLRTETHVPLAWSQGHMDWKYIKSIHDQFGTIKLRTFPHMNYWECQKSSSYVRIDILNYLDYVKRDAKKLLQEKLCWKDYGGKHYESIYTRFYQGYILYRKFGYDKRRSHFSSLICSGEMTREEALRELKNEPYPVEMQKEDKEYIIKKFCLTEKEFDEIMHLPKKSYWDYPSYGRFYKSPAYKSARAIYRLFNPKPA